MIKSSGRSYGSAAKTFYIIPLPALLRLPRHINPFHAKVFAAADAVTSQKKRFLRQGGPSKNVNFVEFGLILLSMHEQPEFRQEVLWRVSRQLETLRHRCHIKP